MRKFPVPAITKVILFILLALSMPLPRNLAAQSQREQIRIIGAISKYLERVGEVQAAQRLRRMLQEGTIQVVPQIKDDAGGQIFGELDNRVIRLNKSMFGNIFDPDTTGGAVFSDTVKAAQTLYHEMLHAEQSTLTLMNTTKKETEAWTQTADASALWVSRLRAKYEAASDPEERKRLLLLLRDTVSAWADYLATIANDKIPSKEVNDNGKWLGLDGNRGTIKEVTSAARKYRDSLNAEVRSYWPGRSGPTAKGPAPKRYVDDLEAPELQSILDCACRLSTSCTATAKYDTRPMDASGSCRETANGPCYCMGFGCLRSPLNPDHLSRCLQDASVVSDSDVVNRLLKTMQADTAKNGRKPDGSWKATNGDTTARMNVFGQSWTLKQAHAANDKPATTVYTVLKTGNVTSAGTYVHTDVKGNWTGSWEATMVSNNELSLAWHDDASGANGIVVFARDGAAAPPEPAQSTGNRWQCSGKNYGFEKRNGSWVEFMENGSVRFRLVEVSRNSQYLELLDQGRNVSVRIFSDRFAWSDDRKNWTDECKGGGWK